MSDSDTTSIYSDTTSTYTDFASQPPMPAAESRDCDILYIDARRLTRDCVSCQLATHLPELSIESAMSAADFPTDGFSRKRYGLTILHTHMAAVDDPAVASQLSLLSQIMPEVPLVLLSDSELVDNISRAFHLGVRGYIPTSLPMKEAAEVIRFVWAGGSFVPLSALSGSLRAPDCGGPDRRDRIVARLTQRQNEVLRRLWQGKPNKVIAYELKMCESTVKVHIRNIMKKLHARNRTQVVLMTHSPSFDEVA
jgi:DNA-binding NarL/FixJ family response regulator